MLIGIWLTTACNLNCKYCYEGSEKKYMIMDFDMANQCIEYILSTLAEESLLIIQFHGGEPLLNYSMLKYMIVSLLKNKNKSQKIMFGITTNATLLNQDKVKFLSKYMNYGFSISIDGNKEVNDKMRVYDDGYGTYDLIIENIKKALEYNPNIRCRMTFTSQTVNKLCESVYHLVKIGAHQIVSIPDYFDKGWTEETLLIYGQQLKEIKRIYLERNLYLKNIEITLLKNNIFKKTKCSGGYDSIHISPNGELYPCIYVVGNPKYKIGTIYSGIHIEILEQISKVNDKLIIECDGCNNYRNCNSVRCRYLNELLTGNCMMPSPVVCAFENQNIKFIH